MKTKNQELLEKFNQAFANNDADYVISQVSDSIKWIAVGDFTVEGKPAFSEKIREMISGDPFQLEIPRTYQERTPERL